MPYQVGHSICEGADVECGRAVKGLCGEVHCHLPVPVLHHNLPAIGAGTCVLLPAVHCRVLKTCSLDTLHAVLPAPQEG